jgi:hypothetical protein
VTTTNSDGIVATPRDSEALRLVLAAYLDIANDIGRSPGVTAVEDSARFFARPDECVGFVNEQRRPLILDISEDRRRTDIARELGSGRQPVEQYQHASFARSASSAKSTRQRAKCRQRRTSRHAKSRARVLRRRAWAKRYTA